MSTSKRQVVAGPCYTVGTKRKKHDPDLWGDQQWCFVRDKYSDSLGWSGLATSKFRYHDRAIKEHRARKRHQVKLDRLASKAELVAQELDYYEDQK